MSFVSAQQAGDSNLQAQLQRLQSAVQQVRQGSPANMTPAFVPDQTPTTGMISPPGAPPIAVPGQPNQVQINQNLAGGGATVAPTQPLPPTGVAPGAVTASTEGGTGIVETLNMRDQAFTDTADNLLPLTPDQIRTLHSLFNHTQRAVNDHPDIPPRPTSTSKIVNMSPGATPPIIRLASGFVTSLVFLDGSGAPWPIEAYDLGDPRSYNIQWDRKSNMLLVQAITENKSGNLAVMLRTLNTPVMITLLPGQRAVDYRVDLRIPGLGPNAVPPIISPIAGLGLPPTSNPILLDVLNGVPPLGARALQIMGRDCQVWLLGKKMYVRTRMTVLSPAWISTLSSADGMHAYEMLPTPVILASENGKMVRLVVQGL